MKKLFLLLSCFALIFVTEQVNAQCATGETEIVITVITDNYGSETEWSFSDGSGTLVSGGPYTDGGSETTVETLCVPENGAYSFSITDAYGDGICCSYGNGSYTITADGITVVSGGEFGASALEEFNLPLPALDGAMVAVNRGPNVAVSREINIRGTFKNAGIATITSVDVSWSVDGGTTAYTDNLTGLNLPTGAQMDFTHSTKWTPDAVGNYDLKVWIENVNGQTDDATNNTESLPLNAFEAPRNTMIETFTNASCPPCAAAMPILDANLNANEGFVYMVSYHTQFPGTDPMYNHNTSDVTTRQNYYDVSGVPSSYIDGTYKYPSSISSADIYNGAIGVTNFGISNGVAYMDADGALQVTADISTLVAPASGDIRTFIAAVERNVEFNSPPGSNGEKEFSWVMKKLLTGDTGTEMGAFNAAETKSVAGSWTPANVYHEDELRVIVFVQNLTTKQVYQAAMVPIGEMVLAADDLKEGPSFVMFPNPVSDVLSVAFDFEDAKDLNIQVTNTLGQTVKSMSMTNVANDKITFNVNELSNGIYFLNVENNGKITSKRFVVSK